MPMSGLTSSSRRINFSRVSGDADGQTDASGAPLSVNLITRAGTSSTEGTSRSHSPRWCMKRGPRARAQVSPYKYAPRISRDLLHRGGIAPITCFLPSVIKRLAAFPAEWTSLVEVLRLFGIPPPSVLRDALIESYLRKRLANTAAFGQRHSNI